MTLTLTLLSGTLDGVLWIGSLWDLGSPFDAVVWRELFLDGPVSSSFGVKLDGLLAHGLDKVISAYLSKVLGDRVNHLSKGIDLVVDIVTLKVIYLAEGDLFGLEHLF